MHYQTSCSGSESNFSTCTSTNYPNTHLRFCSHYDDVTLQCSGKLSSNDSINIKKMKIYRVNYNCHYQPLAMKEMLDYMEVQSREQELFMSVLMVPGEKFVEVKTIPCLHLSFVPNLDTHLMVGSS